MADIEYIRDSTGSGGRLRAISPDGIRHLDGYVQDAYGWVKFLRLDATMEFLKNNNATIKEPDTETNYTVDPKDITDLKSYAAINWALGVIRAYDHEFDASYLEATLHSIETKILNER